MDSPPAGIQYTPALTDSPQQLFRRAWQGHRPPRRIDGWQRLRRLLRRWGTCHQCATACSGRRRFTLRPLSRSV